MAAVADERHAALEQALALSERMQAAAENEAWQQVADLEHERQRQLQRGYPNDARSRHLLLAMLKQNQALLARIGGVQEGLGRELARQRERRHALNTYMAVVKGHLSA
jgi:hypothetical protein